MTDDEIKALMRATDTDGYPSDLRRLVEAVQEREREACAALCEVLPTPAEYMTANASHWECGTIACADAIRNRSNA